MREITRNEIIALSRELLATVGIYSSVLGKDPPLKLREGHEYSELQHGITSPEEARAAFRKEFPRERAPETKVFVPAAAAEAEDATAWFQRVMAQE